MRKFNKQLNRDITKLKTLHMKKDKSEFNKMKDEIMKRHRISKATVYREMKKEQPGFYKKPNYYPPVRDITEKEKELVSGMFFKQMTLEQIRAELEKQSGESYSWDRVDRIRENIEKGKNTIPENKIMNLSEKNTGNFEYESPHGEDMKIFLGKILEIEKMDPRSYITIPHKGYGVKMSYCAVNYIHRLVANTAAGRGYDEAEIAKINTRHLCYEQVRLFSQGRAHSVKELAELNKMLNGFESTGSRPGIDFEFLVDMVQHFAGKKVKREDIVFIASVNAENYKGLSKEMEPPEDEANAATIKWARKNM